MVICHRILPSLDEIYLVMATWIASFKSCQLCSTEFCKGFEALKNVLEILGVYVLKQLCYLYDRDNPTRNFLINWDMVTVDGKCYYLMIKHSRSNMKINSTDKIQDPVHGYPWLVNWQTVLSCGYLWYQ